MALIHEIPESIVNRLALSREIDEKFKEALLEKVLNSLLKSLPETSKSEFLEAWKEYKSQLSEEAKLVDDLDKVEVLVEILEHLKDVRELPSEAEVLSFIRKANMKTEAGKMLWVKLVEKYLKKLQTKNKT
jgi:5'-deoxynucleotidase YfbR-like HD superfamily hydrolase